MKIHNLIKSILLILLYSIIMFSCTYNYKDVEVKGVVVNSETSKPINDAEILITYWVYNTDTWDSKSQKKITRTNEKGQFNFNFEQVEALDIKVNANDYQQWMKSITVKKRKINLEIVMSPLMP